MRKILIALASIPLILFCTFTKKDHFTLEKLRHNLEGEGVPLGYTITGPLKYLGNGNEAVAFLTSDGDHVVKFFLTKGIAKQHQFKPLRRLRQLFSHKPSRERGVDGILRYEKAFELLKEETGLIAIHLKRSEEKLPIVTLIDYRGREYRADLNELAFVVQKRGDVLYNRFRVTPEMKGQFDQLFQAIQDKGFIVRSTIFFPYNYALCEGKAVMIDLGKLEFVPGYTGEKERLHVRYDRWVERKARKV